MLTKFIKQMCSSLIIIKITIYKLFKLLIKIYYKYLESKTIFFI